MAEPPSGAQQDPLDRIVVVLVHHNVDFIAIGGWAVQAQQYDLGRVTYDIDVTPEGSRENLQRLSAALNELGAEVRHEDETLPFSHDGESLGRAAVWNLSCRHGDFDICLEPTGIDGGYDELSRSAHTVAIEVGDETVPVRCADLADIVRSKQTANRFKDRQDLAVLVPQLQHNHPHRRDPNDPVSETEHEAPQHQQHLWGIDQVLYETEHDGPQLKQHHTRRRGYDGGLGL
ncbi:MAG: hypothetical protein OXH58_03135 [Acidimicrobiaceae bacterium]|nr:hypothetical protein [Acidimicrobiaceae bacterium]